MITGIFIGVYATVTAIFFLMGGAEDWKEFLAIVFWPIALILGLGYGAFMGLRTILKLSEEK